MLIDHLSENVRAPADEPIDELSAAVLSAAGTVKIVQRAHRLLNSARPWAFYTLIPLLLIIIVYFIIESGVFPPLLKPTPTITQSAGGALATLAAMGTATQPPTTSPTSTSAPVAADSTPTPFLYTVQGSPLYMQNLMNDRACDFLGVAGQVLDRSGAPVTGLYIHAGGIGDSQMTLTGISTAYGSGGYEVMLADQPQETTQTVWVQVFDAADQPLSDRIILDTYADCSRNLVLLNFLETGERPQAIFDFPVGSTEQRAAPIDTELERYAQMPRWLEDWYDATPFLSFYALGYSTGADLNRTSGPDDDQDQPVYAIGDGEVIFAAQTYATWNGLVVIRHPEALVRLPDGSTQRQDVYSRYSLLGNLAVVTGDHVTRGQQIGAIGYPGQTTGFHLSFDISHSGILASRPGYWPDISRLQELRNAGSTGTQEYQDAQADVLADVQDNFLDPLQFMIDNHNPP